MAAASEEVKQESAVRKGSLADWKKSKRHEVVLPSGFMVEIEIPNLPQLVKTGHFSNDLMEAAIGVISKQEITRDLIDKQADFYTKLVALTVKSPEITEEEVSELPFEDVEMLVELATRNRDIDALYRHIGGLHRSATWRNFRGLDNEYEDLGDV